MSPLSLPSLSHSHPHLSRLIPLSHLSLSLPLDACRSGTPRRARRPRPPRGPPSKGYSPRAAGCSASRPTPAPPSGPPRRYLNPPAFPTSHGYLHCIQAYGAGCDQVLLVSGTDAHVSLRLGAHHFYCDIRPPLQATAAEAGRRQKGEYLRAVKVQTEEDGGEWLCLDPCEDTAMDLPRAKVCVSPCRAPFSRLFLSLFACHVVLILHAPLPRSCPCVHIPCDEITRAAAPAAWTLTTTRSTAAGPSG